MLYLDKSLWKTDDKEWMIQRKEEWRYIQKNLDIIRDYPNFEIKKKHYKYHKELFFKGEYELTKDDLEHFERPLGCPVFFNIWYCPEKSVEAYRKILDSVTDRIAEGNLKRGQLEDFEYAQCDTYFLNNAGKVKYDENYGFMGGREELVTRAMYPSYDYDDVKIIRNEELDREIKVHYGPSIETLGRYVVAPLDSLFRRGANKIKFLPAQYLWDHFDFAFTNNPGMLSDLQTRQLVAVLYICKHRESYKEFPHDKPHFVDFAENLRQRFENNEFGEPLLEYWNSIETLIKKHPSPGLA